MNTYQDAVDVAGPLVKIAVNLTTATLMNFRRAARPVPQVIEVLALIDLGADVTVFDPVILTPLCALGLTPSRWIHVNAPALGPVAPVPEYAISLQLPVGRPNPLLFKALPVYERPLGALGYHALIGRDVLASCGLLYDGPGRRFTLMY